MMKRVRKISYFGFLVLFLFNYALSQSYRNSNDISSKNIILKMDNHIEFQKPKADQNFWKQVDTLIYIDTIFILENSGMDRIIVELNGYIFRLTTDPSETKLGDNIFVMPADGKLIIDIGRYINPDPQVTIIRWNYQGQVGDTTEILIGDSSILMGEEIDFILHLIKLPSKFSVSQNFPNPFNEITNINITIPNSWLNGADVELIIYNALGQKVKTLFSGQRLYGNFPLQWDGRNDRGVKVSSGVYLYRVRAGDQNVVRKMFLIR